MKYEEMLKVSYDFFDTIDFKKWIEVGGRIDLQDLMNCIEEFYQTRPNLLPKEFQGYFFNFVNEYEFGKYLEQRYGWEVEEVVIEKHYIIPT